MSSRLLGFAVLWSAVAVICGPLGASAETSETGSPELRYGFEADKDYLYEVKIVGEISSRKSTSKGILTYNAKKASDTQFELGASGMLSEHWESTDDDHMMGPFPPFGPRGMIGPWAPGRGATTFSRSGTLISTKSDTHLPFVLGRRDALVVEPLSETPKASWTAEMDVAVVERMAVGPFFSRLTSFQNERETIAKERIEYKILEQKDGIVRIAKNYSMKTLPDEGIVRFDMAGGGEFEFDTRRGAIRSCSAEYKIKVNEKNITLTIPVSVEYTLLSEAEVAERKQKREEAAAEKAAAMAPKPFEPGEQEKLLADLASGDNKRIQAAAGRLAKVVRKDEPADAVGRALIAALKDRNPNVKKDIWKALEVWTIPEAQKAAIRALRSEHAPFIGDEALVVLAKFRTPEAAAAAAAALASPHTRREAADALIDIGPVAEDVTIPFIKDRDQWISSDACRVVGEIGGEKSLKALKEQLLEFRGHGHMARRALTGAIDAIERRGGKPPAMPAANEFSGPATDGVMRTWQDATRSFQIEAQFVKHENNEVTLRREDGRVIVVPLEKLCDEDREFVKKQKKLVNPFE